MMARLKQFQLQEIVFSYLLFSNVCMRKHALSKSLGIKKSSLGKCLTALRKEKLVDLYKHKYWGVV